MSSVFYSRINQSATPLRRVPHLLVRRPARSHLWSNATDRVWESSVRPFSRATGDLGFE